MTEETLCAPVPPPHAPDALAESPTLPAGWLKVDSLDIEAQGIARKPDGKVVFIEGALPFEVVSVNVHRKKNNWEAGTVTAIHQESSQRVRPGCPHFGLHTGACGGCKMQHLHAAAQVAVKQRVLEDNLWHLAKVRAETLLRPIEGPTWGYRYRARLSVRYVHKKGRGAGGLSRAQEPLRGGHPRMPGAAAPRRRHADAAARADLQPGRARDLPADRTGRRRRRLRRWCCGIWSPCPKTIWPACAPLRCNMTCNGGCSPKAPIRCICSTKGAPLWRMPCPTSASPCPSSPPTSPRSTRTSTACWCRARCACWPWKSTERVIDWFCGLGNFTLPLATQAREVLGIEGSETLVARSRENYEKNKADPSALRSLCATEFVARNLFEMTPAMLVADGSADKWLVDPPREGAFALAKAVADLHQARIGAEDAPPLPPGAEHWTPPKRIVYVSCNPATLARDAGLLVHLGGYRCVQAGVVNMFPHTAHVESIAVFERDAA
jgi:23S rRNA (uracil1939-C5)-methyltransferase